MQAEQMQEYGQLAMGAVKDIASAAQEDEFQKATYEGYKAMQGMEQAASPEMDEKFYKGGLGAKRAMNSQLGVLATQMLRDQQAQTMPPTQQIPGTDYIAFGRQALPMARGPEDTALPAVSVDQDQQMQDAGYIYDPMSGKYVADRSKNQSGGSLVDLLIGNAGQQGNAATPSAPSQPRTNASTVKEGDVVSQNGQRYRYTGGQYVLIP
jgi:hypothetical protein